MLPSVSTAIAMKPHWPVDIFSCCTRPAPPPRPVPPKPDHSLEIARILAGCQPLAGTAAET